MILILGGTTEGRIAAKVCEEAGKSFYYSTRTALQDLSCPHAIPITGGMDRDELVSCCKENDIKLLVDAAHPFAGNLHTNVADAADMLNIPVVRLERSYPEEENENVVWVSSYDEAITYFTSTHITRLLALTGVSTIAKLKPYWLPNDCWFRILDREESRELARKAEFPTDKIIYYSADSNEYELFSKLKPQAILTKESGESGGFSDKLEAAKKLGIPLIVIRRPQLSPSFITVYGAYGLRMQVERALPGFFSLRIGYTTGTCATAAAKAALLALIFKQKQGSVPITLPDGEKLIIPVKNTTIDRHSATATVVKYAGDDPDVTNGLEIVATVTLSDGFSGVRFLQGEGVGTVTLDGLGLAVGEPAINPTPRRMIERELMAILRQQPDTASGVELTIAVPKGREVAQRTFNPKLGIVGGISIIGTSGIVKPFSTEAFVSSIRKEMEVTKAMGCAHVVINSGAKSEAFVRREFSNLPDLAFIHYGNFIGETLKIASELGFSKVSLGVMIGKAVKLAEGYLDTHSKKAVMNIAFLSELAKESGCSAKTVKAIEGITLARQLWEVIPTGEEAFFSLLIKKCYEVCASLLPIGKLTILLISEDGRVYS